MLSLSASRKFLVLVLVFAVVSSFGVMVLAGEEGGQKTQPEVTDPWCTVSDCNTHCTDDGPGYWRCWAHTEAEHYDEYGNPQPVTAIATAEGTATCINTTYNSSSSNSQSGYGTAEVTASVYVGGTLCHGDVPKECEDEGSCNCTS